jgi:hypothetical protein
MIEGTLLVDGDFEGDILNCDGSSWGPTATCARTSTCASDRGGRFDGGIQAEERIELLGGAR